MKHVPNGAQNPVANLLADLLNRAVSSGTLDDVAKLLFMPGFVLAPLVRGGKKHDGKSAKIVEERITRFLAGEFEPEAASTRRRKPLVFPSEGLSSATERMVVNAVRDKSLSKACKLLLNGSLPAPVNVQEKLEALHPAGEIPADHDAAPGSFDFDESEVESAVRSFDPSSGGGPFRAATATPSGAAAGELPRAPCPSPRFLLQRFGKWALLNAMHEASDRCQTGGTPEARQRAETHRHG